MFPGNDVEAYPYVWTYGCSIPETLTYDTVINER
jgi:hypothetical protein